MPKKPPKDNPDCPKCSNKETIKQGFKKNKHRTIQKFQCKSCNHHFTLQPALQKHKTYPINLILDAINNLNLGYTIKQTKNYYQKHKINKSTLSYWYNQLKKDISFHRLRDISLNPTEIIIKKQFIHHSQPFLYQYHSLKLNFAKKFPTLISYLKEINKSLPKQIFNNSERISKMSKETPTMAGPGEAPSGVVGRTKCKAFWPSPAIKLGGVSSKSKQNYAVKLAQLAKEITNDNKQRHNIIENFMLINDTATIATEIPIYLTKQETKQNNLTGHIDILQIRYHKIYILDFKPEPVNKQQTISQLKLYREALSKRTQIPTYKFKLAFFNHEGYYEIN